ncbi:hypothetical protein GCM10020358_60640 [Amorphoplanes nipponensis]|uniref:hypothetical protein n=1 Tax=Actinoplanes nipponensis TaxID=135950 RepID=UPI0031F1C0C9
MAAPIENHDPSAEARTEPSGISRKNLLKAAALAVPAPLLLGGAARAFGGTPSGPPLAPTPFCDDGDDPTPSQMEGPYFKPSSPERRSLLEPGLAGVRLTVTGYVFGLSLPALGERAACWTSGRPMPTARTTTRFRLRGHQVHRRAGRLHADHDRARSVSRAYPAHPRQGAGAEPSGADHAVVLSE